MATLDTQYKNYLAEHPDSTYTYEQWLEFHSTMLGESLKDLELKFCTTHEREKVNGICAECHAEASRSL